MSNNFELNEYEEMIRGICTSVEYGNEESVKKALGRLAEEAVECHDVVTYMEEYLEKTLSKEEFANLIKVVAQRAFDRSVDRLPEGDFKEFCKQNRGMMFEGIGKTLN